MILASPMHKVKLRAQQTDTFNSSSKSSVFAGAGLGP